jgi:hypothetical protein
MKLAIYHILHVGALFILAGFTFGALANPKPETKKKVMMVTGIMSLIVLITGFGMLAVLGLGFPVWIIIKVICWIGLSVIAGVAYRKPDMTGTLSIAAIVLILLAVAAVYWRGGFATYE